VAASEGSEDATEVFAGWRSGRIGAKALKCRLKFLYTRELEEVIEQAVARCQGSTVTAQDLPQALWEQARVPVWSGEAIQFPLSGDAFRLPSGGIVLAEVEKSLIQQALEQSHQNKSRAALLLGLSRTQLRTRMRHYELE
jgi:DNA-binding NtrC family response regulator